MGWQVWWDSVASENHIDRHDCGDDEHDGNGDQYPPVREHSDMPVMAPCDGKIPSVCVASVRAVARVVVVEGLSQHVCGKLQAGECGVGEIRIDDALQGESEPSSVGTSDDGSV